MSALAAREPSRRCVLYPWSSSAIDCMRSTTPPRFARRWRYFEIAQPDSLMRHNFVSTSTCPPMYIHPSGPSKDVGVVSDLAAALRRCNAARKRSERSRANFPCVEHAHLTSRLLLEVVVVLVCSCCCLHPASPHSSTSACLYYVPPLVQRFRGRRSQIRCTLSGEN